MKAFFAVSVGFMLLLSFVVFFGCSEDVVQPPHPLNSSLKVAFAPAEDQIAYGDLEIKSGLDEEPVYSARADFDFEEHALVFEQVSLSAGSYYVSVFAFNSDSLYLYMVVDDGPHEVSPSNTQISLNMAKAPIHCIVDPAEGLDFGSTALGDTSTLAITLTNGDNDWPTPLDFDVQLESDVFSLVGGISSGTIFPDSSRSFTFVFHPLTAGSQTVEVSLGNPEDGFHCEPVVLRGSGIGGTITIEGTPDTLQIGWELSGPMGYSLSGTGHRSIADAIPGQYEINWGDVEGYVTPLSSTQDLKIDQPITFTGNYKKKLGSVSVDPNPNELNAPWSLTKPDGTTQTGNGDKSFEDMPTGEYGIAWQDVVGYDSPSDRSLVLAAEGQISFTGTYLNQYGTITISPKPDGIDAGWTLSGPNNYSTSGQGSHLIQELELGVYSLTWGSVSGFSRPSPDTIEGTLTQAEDLVFEGQYTDHRGTVSVTVDPSSISAEWTLAGPESSSWSQSGSHTFTDMLPGNYTINWGSEDGWDSPVNETRSLANNGSEEFVGSYNLPEPEFSISGVVSTTSSQVLSGVLVALSGDATGSAATNSEGRYTLGGLVSGNYRLDFTKAGYVSDFSEITISNSDIIKDKALSPNTDPTGTVSVTVDPSSISAEWTLSGPESYTQIGHGDETIHNLDPGSYTIEWGAVSGYVTPSPYNFSLVAGGQVIVSAQYTPSQSYFYDSFEAISGWSAGGLWNRSTLAGIENTAYPDYVSGAANDNAPGLFPSAFDGAYVFWFGNGDQGNFMGTQATGDLLHSGGESVASQSGSLISPPIVIPVSAAHPALTFMSWYEIESVEPHSFDTMGVKVVDVNGVISPEEYSLNPLSDPGSGARDIPYTSGGFNKAPQWQPVNVDLSQFVGSTIKIQFIFATHDTHYNGFRGWICDSVKIAEPSKACSNQLTFTPTIGKILRPTSR